VIRFSQIIFVSSGLISHTSRVFQSIIHIDIECGTIIGNINEVPHTIIDTSACGWVEIIGITHDSNDSTCTISDDDIESFGITWCSSTEDTSCTCHRSLDIEGDASSSIALDRR